MSEENTGEVVVEPVVAPEVEAPAVDAPAEGAEVADPPAPEPDAPVELTPEQKAIKKLEGRVGFKTKELNARDQKIAELQRQNEAYQALLAANGPEGGDDPAKPAGEAPKPSGERTFTRAEIQTEVARIEFNKQADASYEDGVKKYPDSFKEAVEHLNSVGMMTVSFLEAALATDSAPDLINYLGNEPDEAARIANLSPVKLGVELAKLAGKLSAPKSVKVSGAPAPIKPLGGAAQAEVDLYDPKISITDFAERLAKNGVAWARPPKRTY